MIPGYLKQLPYAEQVSKTLGTIFHHSIPSYIKSNISSEKYCAPSSLAFLPAESGTDPLRSQVDLPIQPFPSTNKISNPVLTGSDVTDFEGTEYVADPFLFPGADSWHLFFESYSSNNDPDAVIGHATYDSETGWIYNGIALNTGFHLSFPYVFVWDGQHYMVPEQEHPDGHTLTLYRAQSFPNSWVRETNILTPDHAAKDPVLFRWQNRWWLIVADPSEHALYVYHAEGLKQDCWQPHVDNPVVVSRPAAGRPAGRPIVRSTDVIMFYQDCSGRYGRLVRGYTIQELSENVFKDAELPNSPILSPPEQKIGWNSGCMHHFDLWFDDQSWVSAVDGNIEFGTEIFTTAHWSVGIFGGNRS